MSSGRVWLGGAWVSVAVIIAAILAVGGPGGGGDPTPTPTATATATPTPTATATPPGGDCDRSATTSNFTTQLASTAAGEVLCLASGNYGTYTGTSGNKSTPGVLIRAADGASPSIALQFRSTPTASWLTFDGVKITGCEFSAPANHITMRNAEMSGYCSVNPGAGPGANNACTACPAMNNSAITFGPNLNLTLSACPSGSCLGGEGRITFLYGSSNPAGVLITGNTFDGNCADGVQFTGSSNAGRGVTIENNVFKNLRQGSCAPHVDSIQFVSGCCVTVRGNLFTNVSSGFVGYDGAADDTTFTNNVVVGTSDGPAYCIGGGDDGLVEHNVFRAGQTYMCVNHSNDASTGVTWRNNVQNGPPTIQGSSSYSVNDYNVCTAGTCAGSHSSSGSVSFVGGSSPNTWAGFALADGSRGKGAASDGTDVGINP